MTAKQNYLRTLMLGLAIVLVTAGCAKKKAPAPPAAPPPPPPAPTASISVNPATIQRGQSAQLTWQTDNATEVSIDGIGNVDPSGSKTVNPADSTTYHLVAKGPGGEQEATTRITVTTPPPPPAPAPTLTDQQWFEQNVKDAYYDYDSYTVRPDAQQALAADAQALKQRPNLKITIEGHADERGSTEYNLVLGDERAKAAKQALVEGGVDAGRISIISYGKEKPFCTESNESCWQQNRRAHLVLTQ